MISKDAQLPTSDRIVRNIQALRVLAVFLVVCLHLQLTQNGIDLNPHPILRPFNIFGKAGVDLFFVISGFIMLVTNWDSFSTPNIGINFLVHRIIRIYPPYWLALLPLTFIFFFARRHFMMGHSPDNTDLFASLLLYPQPIHKTLLPLAWTLAFEMTFYVMFAFVLCLERRHITWLLASWAAIHAVLYLAFGWSSNPYLRYIGSLQPVEFLLGIAIGLLFVRNNLPHPAKILALGVGLAIATCIYTTLTEKLPFDLDRVAVFGLPFAMILYGAVAFEKSRRFIAPSWLVSMGSTTYATYLWHFTIIGAMRQLILRYGNTGRFFEIITILITLAIIQYFSYLVHVYFEAPVTSRLRMQATYVLRSLQRRSSQDPGTRYNPIETVNDRA